MVYIKGLRESQLMKIGGGIVQIGMEAANRKQHLPLTFSIISISRPIPALFLKLKKQVVSL